MIRNLKTLGVTFVVMLALSAVAASTAHATPADFRVGGAGALTTAEYTVEQDPTAKTQLIKTKVGNFSCDEFHATAKGATPTNSLTLENIKYGKCTLGGIAATVNFNAGAVPCHYTITSGDTEGTGSTGDLTIGPANCTIKFESVLAKCNKSISGGQTFEDSITYTNVKTPEKPEEITGHMTVQNLKYTTLNATCPGGGAGEGTNGTIEGTFTMRGFNTSKVQQDLTLVDTA